MRKESQDLWNPLLSPETHNIDYDLSVPPSLPLAGVPACGLRN